QILLRSSLLAALFLCAAQAVLSGGKDVKRHEAGFDTYGPLSRSALQYGSPPSQQHIPHHEYGVPQQIPFREYGPPALKYGPPKLNFLSGGSSGGSSSSSGLHEQIKTYFGVPKPYYGPPHIQHKPSAQYGSSPPKPAFGSPSPYYGPTPPLSGPQYGPPSPQPAPQYGPPQPQYGPPPLQQQRPAPQYGPPKPQFVGLFTGPPQPLPAPHPAPLFKPAHQPATSYGPPASGPLNLPPKPVYDTPSNYGPPPLPVNLPGPRPNFNRVPETTIILTGASGGQQLPSGPASGPVKQVQIQIDASGHTHSVSGSQAPFHTACDGWKPIPAPVGAYVEQNHIEAQGGYSSVNQDHQAQVQVQTQSHGQSLNQNFGTQYSLGIDGGSGPSGASGSNIVEGLSDEQLVAVALQGDTGNGPVGDGQLNSIDSEALQLSVGAIDDSYTKPPADSFAPNSVHAHKYQTLSSDPGAALPPSPPQPLTILRPNYGPPPPPPPHFAALTSSHSQSQSQSFSNSHSNVNVQYGLPLGNPPAFPQHGAGQPNKPVAYRPPVPVGLLESIGATVQHLDQFGKKPPQQPPTYIPPATHEIALNGPPSVRPPSQSLTHFAAPPPPPQILQQQLPQSLPGPLFGHHQKPLQLQQYGPPEAGAPVPPQPHYQPAPPSQQYLPAPSAVFLQQQQKLQQQHLENSNSASQYTQQFVQSQGLPLAQQALRFTHPSHQQTLVVHDCGHGPNLVSNAGYQVGQQLQVQQQLQQHFGGSVSASSAGAYNAIAQSIPVAEQHTQFVTGPSDSYGPPPSGNDIDFDHSGYASQKSAVAALPDGTVPQQLPGLDGLNIISAQKSQSIQLEAHSDQQAKDFQVQFGSALNGGGRVEAAVGAADLEQGANHEEILSQGLLQSILTAIEQPQSTSSTLPQNHKAQSRSDEEHSELEQQEEQLEDDDGQNEQQEQQHRSASNRVEVRVLPDADVYKDELRAVVKELEPIVAAEVDEKAKH
ncbi:hypothetical protein KR222_010842, partial [Zaprionus bogoriensis]